MSTDFPWNDGNWGRWDNQRGTLNLIDAASVLAAAQEVRFGTVFPCGRPLTEDTASYYADVSDAAFKHEMITAWKGHAGGDIQAASDHVYIQPHGLSVTHLDALCHFGFHGKGFEGQPFEDIVTMDGATHGGVEHMQGLVTRGVLADVPRRRGVEHLEPGDPVMPEDLEETLEDCSPGDALLIRTGRWQATAGSTADEQHERLSGLHHDCMPLIQDADIAVLATDAAGDNFPPTLDGCERPIHIFTLMYLEMPLLHNLDLDALAEACEAQSRSRLMFTVAPLNMPGATGSPVNPTAIL